MRSDIRYGVPVSGGMDSSSLLVTVRKLMDANPGQSNELNSFVVSKPGILDETQYAQGVSKKADANLTQIQSPSSLSVDTLRQLTYNYEDIGRFSEGPSKLYQSMREKGYVVSLDGHGADELMAGYPQYMTPAMDAAMTGIPNMARLLDLSFISKNIAFNSESQTIWQGWNGVKHQLKTSAKKRFGKPDQRRPKSGKLPFGLEPLKLKGSAAFADDRNNYPGHFDALDKALYADVHYGFLQRILRAFDYASMSHGVEARTPFLDWRLVTFLFSLPSDHKLGKGFTKRLLRTAMDQKIPAEVLKKKSKIGFIDLDTYFRNDKIIQWVTDTLSSQAALQSDIWDGPAVKKSLDRWHNAGGNNLRAFESMTKMAQVVELTETFNKKQRQTITYLK
ncbi:MAG: asparagine synthase C-terminal domain-containing protein, partial [Psychrosphaera sp.]|nr:asparagine synthase C-terminal domain-containing protein [Psychrosphaera sp.]